MSYKIEHPESVHVGEPFIIDVLTSGEWVGDFIPSNKIQKSYSEGELNNVIIEIGNVRNRGEIGDIIKLRGKFDENVIPGEYKININFLLKDGQIETDAFKINIEDNRVYEDAEEYIPDSGFEDANEYKPGKGGGLRVRRKSKRLKSKKRISKKRRTKRSF